MCLTGHRRYCHCWCELSSSKGMSSMSLKEWPWTMKWSETAAGWFRWWWFKPFSIARLCSPNSVQHDSYGHDDQPSNNYNTKSSEAQDANKLLTSCQDREEWGSSRELCKLYRSTRLRGIGHFQVVLNLCFKARLSAKPLIWKWFLFQLVQRKLIITRKVLHLKPRFESESFWNSQMGYSKWRTDNPAGTMKSCTLASLHLES